MCTTLDVTYNLIWATGLSAAQMMLPNGPPVYKQIMAEALGT